MEKRGFAAVASLVAASLLAGFLLGGIVARRAPATVTSYMTVRETVTIAETTVEVPVRHQPAPYSALAYTTCIYTRTAPGEDPGCESNIKAVTLTVQFRELGVERSYIRLDRVAVVAPGLEHNATAEGTPLDSLGRVVVMPGGSASITVVTPVTDLFSFANWMADIGRITLIVYYEDQAGVGLGTISVEGIPVNQQAWRISGNQTEVGAGG